MTYDVIDKYNSSVLDNLDNDNVLKIINFLGDNYCSCIDDLLRDYLDLFTIPYDEFVDKFNKLNFKYNNKFLELAAYDMNFFDEFYYDL